MVVIQQEFRMPVYKMFGLAVFGGIGSVAKSVNQFKTNAVHYSYGCGLRIRVNKKENTNVRIDYGFTKDARGLYIVFAEAF
jgi:hemolysin activation/secretion protein